MTRYVLPILLAVLTGFILGYFFNSGGGLFCKIMLVLIAVIIFLILSSWARVATKEERKKGPSRSRILWVLCILAVILLAWTPGTWAWRWHPFVWSPAGFEHDLTGQIEPGDDDNYTFIVFGDTRTDLHIRWRENHKDSIMAEFRSRYGAGKDIDLSFDAGDNLVRAHIAEGGLVLVYKDGWPETIEKAGRSIYHRVGHDTVYSCVAGHLEPGKAEKAFNRADFAIHTGDMVLWSDTHDNAYWREFKHLFYDRLSPEHKKCVFPVIGNHEYWKDNYAGNYFKVFDHLRRVEKDGSRGPGMHYYAFTYGNGCFIFLCSGGECNGSYSTCWNCAQADFRKQMDWLRAVLARARSAGTEHVFVTYHKPSFSHSSHGPLVERVDPMVVLREFKRKNKEISVTVFGGHNHTTEAYEIEVGDPKHLIRYIVAGGGGAPQHLDRNDKWPDQPDLLWKSTGKELYCYLEVGVNGDSLKFTFHTYNPATKAWEEIRPFGERKTSSVSSGWIPGMLNPDRSCAGDDAVAYPTLLGSARGRFANG